MSDKSNFYKKRRKTNKINEKCNEKPYQSETNDYLNNLDIGRNADIPYYGWRLFFSDKEYKVNSPITKKIKVMEDFIERHEAFSSLFTMANFEAGLFFDIDICELYNDDEFIEQWPNFRDELYENPTNTLNCIKLSIHQKILETVPNEKLQYVLNSISNLPALKLGILNYEPIISLRDLKLNCYGKLISTRGCVIRVGRVRYLAEWIVFACSKCHLQKLIKQWQETYTLPKKCDVCGVSKFYPVLDSSYTKTVLCQIIRIQEPLNDEQENKGSVPKVLDVELLDDLVNICMPGDNITLTGVIKVQGIDDDTTKIQVGTPFSLYMKAITVINNKHRYQNKSSMNTEISLKNYLAIQDIYNKPNLFALLVHSLCPNIYGHEIVKAGLILSLFGGNAKHAQLRDDIHILLVGDPGLGKSQMLQACARISTKGVYICGNSSTSSGLTVTLTKETGSNDFALEPGALVLADQGCCCIDEFDKMCSQHQHFDNLLCKHIMTVHSNLHANSNEEVTVFHNECPLRKKLMLPLSTEIIPQNILRTYISYAREYVKPKLSTEAATVLQNYYLELRSKNEQFGNIPIFNRQLEAMIRLTEARAKLELRMEATESDALDVTNILRYAMIDTIEDSNLTPKLCSDGKLTNRKIKMFMKILEKKVSADKEQIFSVKNLEALATSEAIAISDFNALISKLNEEGVLLKIRKDTYKFISTS
ncbi:DNA helicase MCM8 isoform X2 [Monomorium pharaonis]|uniref:DNA helicase MCM8 isoform X2 n=1 Tax=Monomorium pharaonis TaxID=307658 RepID=UPI001746D230|nr:DNA helicase MCM8 isoform X2 [Monomorium pharaonis]